MTLSAEERTRLRAEANSSTRPYGTRGRDIILRLLDALDEADPMRTETVTDTVTGETFVNTVDAQGWTVSSEPVRLDAHGNAKATEGCTFCWCGAKYWEHDVCVSCGHPYHPDMDAIPPDQRDSNL